MQNFFSQIRLSQQILSRSASLFLAATLIILAGCGSGSIPSPTAGTGGSSGVTQTLTGTAATGAPLVGASVTLKDSLGKTATGTTAADGAFSIAVTGMKPPFMLVAIPASGSNMYSVLPAMDMTTTNSQNVNITPVTTLVMYELNAGADPATMYTGLTFASLSAAAVTAKEALVRGKLPANTVNPVFSMMYGKFVAQVGGNDPYDAALDALGKISSISLAGVTLTTASGASTTYASTASTDSGSGGSTTAGPTLSLKLTDPVTGAPVTSISSAKPGTLTATVTGSTGARVPNAIVSFTTNATLTAISPSATANTNASGVATVTLSPATASAAGSTTITASAQVGTVQVDDSVGFTVGTAAVSVTAPVLGVGAAPLSAFGTTSIDVTVSVGGVPVTTPQNVTFTSFCTNLGKAVLSTGTVTAAGGVATGSYRDNGCAGTDTITAAAAGVTSSPTSLVVLPPTTGSIQFVSASPSSISLKGIGGTEAALVSFKVLDGSGKPLSGKKVTFGLSTAVGGVRMTPSDPIAGSSATSDTDGLVFITVNSGTVSTPVRVTASTVDTSTNPATTLTTQSSGLTISTGIPDQDSFSLSATKLNVEDIDGHTTVLTVRLADHFNNPVPPGTAVNFTTEGGSIVSSCSTVIDGNGNSNCSSTLTVQEPRPSNRRVTVLAYAVGEESFTDLNGNGVADLAPNEMVDLKGNSTDLPEAFRDDNENGVRDTNEPFIDFNQNGIYDGPEGKYSGVLCDSAKSSAGTCSTTKTIHVRRDIVIIFSGSNAVISKTAPSGDIDLVGGCSGTSKQVDLRIVDVVGNPMPAGTTIVVKTSDGTISGTDSFTQASTNVTPAAGVANYTLFVRDDTERDPDTGACKPDSTLSGVLTVTVTTPAGVVSTAQFNVIN